VYKWSGCWADAAWIIVFVLEIKLPIENNNKQTDNIIIVPAVPIFFFANFIYEYINILAVIVSIFIFETLFLYLVSTKL